VLSLKFVFAVPPEIGTLRKVCEKQFMFSKIEVCTIFACILHDFFDKHEK
jgi:hypothetical protein